MADRTGRKLAFIFFCPERFYRLTFRPETAISDMSSYSKNCIWERPSGRFLRFWLQLHGSLLGLLWNPSRSVRTRSYRLKYRVFLASKKSSTLVLIDSMFAQGASMQISIPFKIEYKTEHSVPIPEIVDSLLSLQLLLEEAAQNLETFIPGLSIQKVDVRVQEISHGSLRELLLVAIFAAFQEELEKGVPAIINEFLGIEVPQSTHTLLTVLVLVAVVYGVDYIKELVSPENDASLTKQWKASLIADVAAETGKSPDDVKKILDKRYGKKGRVKQLADASVKFFKPSKDQGNAPILVGNRRIEPQFVEDTEANYVYEEASKVEKTKKYYGVVLQIHQKDLDRETSGWAAIPVGIHPKRLPMKLVDGVTPDMIWDNDEITADIILKSRRIGLGFTPSEIHVVRLKS